MKKVKASVVLSIVVMLLFSMLGSLNVVAATSDFVVRNGVLINMTMPFTQ